MRLTSVLVMAAAILTACRPLPENVTADQCPAWRDIDFAALPTNLNDDPQAALFQDVWKNWTNGETGIVWSTSAPISTVRLITSPGGLTTDPSIREIMGRRDQSGWEIFARSAPTGQTLQVQWTGWRRVTPTSQGQSKLDSLLADPCLWVAPHFLDGPVRLVNGRGDARPDGPSTGYDISHGGRHWGGWHYSWSVGPQGRLRSLLLAESFGVPESPEDSIGPDGWFDWSTPYVAEGLTP